MFDFLTILWYNIAKGLQASIFASWQNAIKATPVYIRFAENNFAFSAVRKKHKKTFIYRAFY